MLYLIMNYSKYFKFIKHAMLNTLMWTKFTICRQDYCAERMKGKIIVLATGSLEN